MPHVVLLRGVNVGGHRRFRPALFARELRHLDAVNIGAAGTFVIRARISQARLRAEIARRLPFAAAVAICSGRDIARLMRQDVFARYNKAGIVRFVSVLTRPARSAPTAPLTMPPRGPWLVKVLARDGRFVLGVYRRHMKVIGYLGALDDVLGAPVTTRNWNTMTAVARVLASRE